MRIVLSCITGILLLLACNNENPNNVITCNTNPSIVLTKTKTVRIPVDTIQYKHFASNVYSNDTLLYYFGLDRGRNAIDIFDINNEVYLASLDFSKEGSPNPLSVTDFYVHNLDSIFVFSSDSYRLQLITIDGNVKYNQVVDNRAINELHYNKSIIGLEPIPAHIYYDASNECIWIPATPYKREGEDNFFDQSFLIGYKFAENKLLSFSGQYPKQFSDKNQTPFTQSAWFDILTSPAKNQFKILFFGSPYVMNYDWVKDTVIGYNCIQSNYLPKEPLEFKGDLESRMERKRFRIKNGLYLSALGQFGAYKYFPVRHPQPLKKVSGHLNDFYSSSWSVVVLDNDWNTVGEMKFPADTYDIYNLHNTTHGFLVSKENPNNDKNEEDYLEFEIYNFIL